jgi:hypothetical protein
MDDPLQPVARKVLIRWMEGSLKVFRAGHSRLEAGAVAWKRRWKITPELLARLNICYEIMFIYHLDDRRKFPVFKSTQNR